MPASNIISLLPFLVDKQYGIIQHLASRSRQSGMPNFFSYRAEVSGSYPEFNNKSIAGGVALSQKKALSKTLGESIERYGSGYIPIDETIQSSYKDLDRHAQHPETFNLYSREQYLNPHFPYEPFTESTSVRWCTGIDIHSKKEILVPSCFIYQPYKVDLENGEREINQVISTGLAAHCSYSEALLNGILEVVERDCFMINWEAKLSRPLIRPQSLPKELKKIIARFEDYGYIINLVNISNESQIPTILGVMTCTEEEAIPFSVAAACHLDPAKAIVKCLEELAQLEYNLKFIRATTTNSIIKTPGDYSRIITFEDHIKLGFDPKYREMASFLTQSDQAINFADLPNFSVNKPEEDLETAITRINATGYDTIGKEITPPDLKALGLFVVRALIPGYRALNKGHDFRRLGGERLNVAVKAIAPERATLDTPANVLPHPFG